MVLAGEEGKEGETRKANSGGKGKRDLLWHGEKQDGRGLPTEEIERSNGKKMTSWTRRREKKWNEKKVTADYRPTG